MELGLWTKAELEPTGEWYQESGQGMGATLTIASEKGGYTLTDRATYLANKDAYSLEILVEGDAVLLNVYHVIVVNPEKWPAMNLAGAQAFAQFMVSAPRPRLAVGVAHTASALHPDPAKTINPPHK
jgi:tungstate transport system substrate-binding protein